MKIGLVGQNNRLSELYIKYFNNQNIIIERIDIEFSYYPNSFVDYDLSFDEQGKYYNDFVASCSRDNRVAWRFFREDVEYLYFIFRSHAKKIVDDIDSIYFVNVPHEGFDIILAEVIEEYDKKWFASYQVPTKPLGICLYTNGFIKLNINNKKEYTYWKEPIYFDKNTYKKNINNLKKEQSIIPEEVCILEKIYSRLALKKRKYKHSKFMKNIINFNIDILEPACVFFLHYQPELTTEPFCNKYSNQLKMMESVMKIAKENHIKINFYMKEHPVASNTWRGEFFNNFLTQMLINYNLNVININSKKILKSENNIGIVTLTGTVGYEAIFYKKSVLCCSSSYYKDIGGVFGFDEIEQFLNSIISSKNKEKLSSLNSVVLKSVFTGVCDPYYVSHDYFNDELHNGIKSIVCNIKRELND